MITVTQSASAQMKKLLSDEPHGHYVRAYISGECCSGINYGFRISSLEEDDWSEGDLVVDPTSLGYFNGATIDYTNDKVKGGIACFVITNPKSQCHFDLWMRQ
jgi:iron-sulfur cluster assembly accessory protein